MQGPDFFDPEPREDIDRQVARIVGEPYAGDYPTLLESREDWGKTFAAAPVVEKTDEPRRKRVSFLPEYVQREHDGPDPATLPRRARRMRIPRGYEFHLHGRDRRRPAI